MGGESGPNFREHDIQWARSMHEFCRTYKIAFFYKQAAARFPGTEPTLDGETIQEFPMKRIRKLSSLGQPDPKGQMSLGF